VTQEEDWNSVAVKSRDVGDVDIVVNNAGYFPNRPIDDLDLATSRLNAVMRDIFDNGAPSKEQHSRLVGSSDRTQDSSARLSLAILRASITRIGPRSKLAVVTLAQARWILA
jgi:hypothetical protein